jgi:CO/xanthine dehydrogenase FAD-binding subunit
MYPRQFEYERAESVDHALEVLEKYGEEARVLAGGMSLIPLMKLRIFSPKYIIDIGRLSELKTIEKKDSSFEIGALVTHSSLIDNKLLKDLPIISSTAKVIGDVQVRNMGTIGGSIAFADPASDWIPTLLALKASVICKSKNRGERKVPLELLLKDSYTLDLKYDEIITKIVIPMSQPNFINVGLHLKLARRTGDYGIAIVSVQANLSREKVIKDIGIGIGAISRVPFRPIEIENIILNNELNNELIENATKEFKNIIEGMEVFSDIKSPEWYRKDVIIYLFKRSLYGILEIAEGRSTVDRFTEKFYE